MTERVLQQMHRVEISLSGVSSSPVEEEDMVLVHASAEGDQDAFAQLVQRHQRSVFRLVFRMLQHYEEACEITQDTFLAAWQSLPSFRGNARFSTWLYRIAYNCSLKQLEQHKHERVLQVAMEAEQIVAHIDDDGRANAELEAYADQDMIREQLSTLPAKYRIVLILRHLQDMTYEEMAEMLTMPIGTIKTHLFRARSLLKERLEGFDREWIARRGS